MDIYNQTLETYLKLGTAVHSAKIKKGHFLAKISAEVLREAGYKVKEEVKIKFPKSEKGSQSSYKADIVVEIDGEILLIDSKSKSDNYNIPVSDAVQKFIKSKAVIQATTSKNVRFILLKNASETDDLDGRITAFGEYGVEMIKSNPWLSKISGKNINLDELSKDFLLETIKKNLREANI